MVSCGIRHRDISSRSFKSSKAGRTFNDCRADCECDLDVTTDQAQSVLTVRKLSRALCVALPVLILKNNQSKSSLLKTSEKHLYN